MVTDTTVEKGERGEEQFCKEHENIEIDRQNLTRQKNDELLQKKRVFKNRYNYQTTLPASTTEWDEKNGFQVTYQGGRIRPKEKRFRDRRGTGGKGGAQKVIPERSRGPHLKNMS